MTIHDRLKLVIKWLIGTGVATNQEAIGRLMGYTNKSSFSQILNDKVPIPGDFINRLCMLNENINLVWIEKEDGDMILDNSASKTSLNMQHTDLGESDSIYYKMYKEKDAEVGALKEEIGALKLRIRQLESQDKEPEHYPARDEATETFISKPSGDYGEGYSPTKPHTTSKRSSAGKI